MSVAEAVHDFHVSLSNTKDDSTTVSDQQGICIVCGPGNNGGDGLVAARHLVHFGYNVSIIAPAVSKATYFPHLIQQCVDLGIPISPSTSTKKSESLVEASVSYFKNFDVIVDAMFGFSFQGPAREPYSSFISAMQTVQSISSGTMRVLLPYLTCICNHEVINIGPRVISVDIPSGWDVDHGDIHNTAFKPAGVISLTVPKLCMRGYSSNYHYVGGR